jgi:hypothetical protein
LLTTRTSHERRSWKRYRCDLETLCHAVEPGSRSIEPGRIQDLSCGGLKLVSPRRYAIGTVLSLAITGADEKAPKTLTVEVMYVTAQPDSDWTMGCRFVQLLSEKDLARLLSLYQEEAGEPRSSPQLASVKPRASRGLASSFLRVLDFPM